ncbi:MAG: MiaB/RimO family radical SAM methylthiotransferase [Candidatus Omnitrophica bacterium]|nr:MiaB/RimO family radical SAM methylthiotransferase [Candidatus Omnitrophota bacterium]
MRTIKFHTLGCKVNQYDTQSIRERFLERGFKENSNGKKADVYLINTCTVTSIADRKSRDIIRRCIKLNPKAKVIVTGCLVEKDSVSLAGIKGLSLIVSKRFFSEGISKFSGHTRAFLKVQDGCDNFCSYCKVPLARGVSRSRPLSDIIADARSLARNGFKEIVLSGICLGSYGKDLSPKINLPDVITALEKIEGLLRIRLSSIEAGDVTDELIDLMAGSRKLCRHLHIPIQSGDDGILKKMNRKYTRAKYLSLIRKIKRNIPQISITTDCLVGFPGESEVGFRNTLDLVKEIIPLKVHIFPYSRRPGTFAADNFKDEIALPVMKERISRLRDAARECSFKHRNKFLHKKMPVLVEGKIEGNAGLWEGYTDNYIRVIFKSSFNLANKIMGVKIRKICDDFCQGA